MHIRRLTPSPPFSDTETPSSYLVSLRPRDLQDQILERLRLNDLPLVAVGQSLDFQIIQRLLTENSRVKADLIGLSLASYRHREASSFRGAETLLNYLLSKLNETELLALQNILKAEIIDDTVISNLINLIRLTGVSDPLKFVELLDNSIRGTNSLRTFIGTVENSTQGSVLKLELLGQQEVSAETIKAINEQEAQGLLEINARAAEIEAGRFGEVDRIKTKQVADVQRILFNTSITFGVSGLVWVGYRFGFWESVVTLLVPQSLQQDNTNNLEKTGVLGNLQLGLAGLTGFFVKKGLLRR